MLRRTLECGADRVSSRRVAAVNRVVALVEPRGQAIRGIRCSIRASAWRPPVLPKTLECGGRRFGDNATVGVGRVATFAHARMEAFFRPLERTYIPMRRLVSDSVSDAGKCPAWTCLIKSVSPEPSFQLLYVPEELS
jgi:hypothetical protein